MKDYNFSDLRIKNKSKQNEHLIETSKAMTKTMQKLKIIDSYDNVDLQEVKSSSRSN